MIGQLTLLILRQVWPSGGQQLTLRVHRFASPAGRTRTRDRGGWGRTRHALLPPKGGGSDDDAGQEENTDLVLDEEVCGGGGKIGDRVLSATALKSTQKATNKDAATRFIEVADTQEKDNEEKEESRMVKSRFSAEYQQGKLQAVGALLRLEKDMASTTKTVELTKANVTSEEYGKWMGTFSGEQRPFGDGGPSTGSTRSQKSD